MIRTPCLGSLDDDTTGLCCLSSSDLIQISFFRELKHAKSCEDLLGAQVISIIELLLSIFYFNMLTRPWYAVAKIKVILMTSWHRRNNITLIPFKYKWRCIKWPFGPLLDKINKGTLFTIWWFVSFKKIYPLSFHIDYSSVTSIWTMIFQLLLINLLFVGASISPLSSFSAVLKSLMNRADHCHGQSLFVRNIFDASGTVACKIDLSLTHFRLWRLCSFKRGQWQTPLNGRPFWRSAEYVCEPNIKFLSDNSLI